MALQLIMIKIQSIRSFSTVHMYYQAILTMHLDCVAADIHTNRMIGLTNMEYYTRLIDYAQKNGGYVPKVSQQRRSCLFHSVRKSIACSREFSNSHLRRMIICFIVNNFELLWPMLHFAIKGNYGHLRLTTDKFREKERLGTLTDREREEYFEPGPFSIVRTADETWILWGGDLSPHHFYDVENQEYHYQWADTETHKEIMHTLFLFVSFSFFFPCINVKCVCVMTGIYAL